MDLAAKEKAEIDFWKNSPYENPSNFSVENIVNKLSEARVFLSKAEFFKKEFSSSKTILEIGAGQGWASCILKKKYPRKKVYASDISKHAIASAKYWEKLFEVKLDKKFPCKSYEIALPNSSVDLVFCFQSAHHFVKQEETLKEIFRVLKKNGRAVYLNEPSCRKFIHKAAHKRVNKKRPVVPEDVLIYGTISKKAKKAGFRKVGMYFNPSLIGRGPVESIYYLFLRKLPILQKILPTTIDYLFSKE